MAQAIRQHEPSLGVRVVDLDRGSVQRPHDVAWFDGPAARKVLGRPHNRRHAHRGLELRKRRHRLDHGRAPGHVELHLIHVAPWLERQAPGIERDPLAHQAQSRALGRVSRVLQANQPGFLDRSLGHRRERPHSRVADLRFIQDCDPHPGMPRRQVVRVLGQGARRKVVGRHIPELTGAVLRLGDERCLTDGPCELLGGGDDKPVDRRL